MTMLIIAIVLGNIQIILKISRVSDFCTIDYTNLEEPMDIMMNPCLAHLETDTFLEVMTRNKG